MSLLPDPTEPFADLQEDCEIWVRTRMGNHVFLSLEERVTRIVEETLELAQAEGIESSTIYRLIDRVYNRPIGKPEQEAAGVSVTLLTYAAAKEFNLGLVTINELARIKAMDPKLFFAKQTEKALQGVALMPRLP
jgi:hypothetical protein